MKLSEIWLPRTHKFNVYLFIHHLDKSFQFPVWKVFYCFVEFEHEIRWLGEHLLNNARQFNVHAKVMIPVRDQGTGGGRALTREGFLGLFIVAVVQMWTEFQK